MSPFGFGTKLGVYELISGDGGDGLLRRGRARVCDSGLVLEHADLFAAGAVRRQKNADRQHAGEDEPGAQRHGAEKKTDDSHSETLVRSQP